MIDIPINVKPSYIPPITMIGSNEDTSFPHERSAFSGSIYVGHE